MRVVQCHLDGSSIGSGVGGVERGKVRHDSDVGNDHFEIGRIDDLASQVFDFGNVVVGGLNARAGRDLQVDGELAGVCLGKEGDTQQRIKREARDKDSGQKLQS